MKLKFNSTGKLKIMHITDTHLSDDNINMSVYLIDMACNKEKPDVVIITGDNVQNCDSDKETKCYINKLMSVFETNGIPVAVTFGNHDSEVGAMSRKELMEYYNSFECSLSRDSKDIPDPATYNIPVYSSNGSNIKFNLWIFDSNDYDEHGHYGCVLENQINWYKQKHNELIKENNGKQIYSLAFQHIIVDEIYNALKKVKKRKLYSFSHMYNKNDYYMFDSDATNFGTLNETPCSGYENHGQFEAMVECGDVLAIFSGHDHTNAFGVKYKGIDISNSLSTRYNGDRFSSQYGYRIIEVDENTTSTYLSRIERWYDMFSLKDLTTIKRSGNELAYKTACDVTFKGLLQKFYTKTGRTFTKLVTGRTVTYKD